MDTIWWLVFCLIFLLLMVVCVQILQWQELIRHRRRIQEQEDITAPMRNMRKFRHYSITNNNAQSDHDKCT